MLHEAPKKSSSRPPRLILAAAFMPLIMSLTLLAGPTTATESSVSDDRTIASEASDTDAIPGDVDCNGDIEVVDALLILREVVALATTSGCGTSDVNCSGATDAVDALALLREMARLSPMPVPDGCPGIDHGKVKPFVEIDSLSCEPATVDPGQAIECYYSVSSSGADHELLWDFGGGTVTRALPAVLGVSCPPDSLPCTFATAGTQSVTFQTSGEKTITLTACATVYCDSEAVNVAVTSVNAR